jgi:hypothetical protein
MMHILFGLVFGTINSAYQNPSGTWRLNWALSEDVRYQEIGYAAPPELLVPSEQLVLSVTDTFATFYESDGAKRRYRLSGKTERSRCRGFDMDTRARWEGHTLRLEMSPSPGLVLVAEYTRSADRLLLLVTVLRAGRRVDPVIRYAYDRFVNS